MKKIFLCLTVVNLSVTMLFSQIGKEHQGEYIIRLKKRVTVQEFLQKNTAQSLVPVRELSRRMNIWLFKSVSNRKLQRSAFANLQSLEEVGAIQENHEVFQRAFMDTTNDPRFAEQWALHNTGQTGGIADADIDAPEAWNISTGGTTVNGDQIVVAVVDGGFDLQHEDLNFWKNSADIPNNGIDDDGNGYIDDYDGWNAYDHNGTIPVDDHGTHVAGIVGAIGNNGIGISGVNQSVKVMPVAGSSTTEATVVEAYGYILEMRARYNESNGVEGAFVVSTNASFGIDYGNPDDYPIWRDIYDSLGKYGVVNCAATSNMNVNVDVNGDMPTACPSDFLIAVTNSDNNDEKYSSAGVGATTIDLAAPGTSILSTVPNDGYQNKTGTSMATPHVAGAVALLVSTANRGWLEQYKEYPSAGALQLKQFILNGVDTLAAFNSITVSGGRLNVYKAILQMQKFLNENDPNPPLQVEATSDYTRVTEVEIHWIDPTSLADGTPIQNTDFTIDIMRDGTPITSVGGGVQQYIDSGLSDGTEYTYILKTRLISNDSTSNPITIRATAGGARKPNPPSRISLSGNADSVLIKWTNPRQNIDGSPMDDFAGIRIYQDGILVQELTRTGADTAKADSSVYKPNPSGYFTWTLSAIDNENPVQESQWGIPALTPMPFPFAEDFSGHLGFFKNENFSTAWTINDTLFESAGGSAFNHYQNNDNNSLQLLGDLGLNRYTQPILKFSHICKTEATYDFGFVEYSTDGGVSWSALPESSYLGQGNYSGQRFDESSYSDWGTTDITPDNTMWKTEMFNLTNFKNESGFLIRFHLSADGYIVRFGWLIDDVAIVEQATGIGQEMAIVPQRLQLKQNFPNPFNPGTIIQFKIPSAGLLSLKIYNILGEEVRTLCHEQTMTPREYSLEWDGRDERGRLVPTGVYIYRLTFNGQSVSRKMMLIK